MTRDPKLDSTVLWEQAIAHRRCQLRSEMESVTSAAMSSLVIVGKVRSDLVQQMVSIRDEMVALGYLEKKIAQLINDGEAPAWW